MPDVRLLIGRLALALATAVLSAVGFDCGLRTLGPSLLARYRLPFNFGPVYHNLEQHPIYGMFHIPNTTNWLWADEFVTRVDINSRGLRERELELEKPPGVRRLAVLGDSFVEAQQVAAEARFTSHLEALLNRAGGESVQVLNSGSTGFGTAQEYLLLKHEVLRYRPDLVVLVMYAENDVGENSYPIHGSNRPYYVLNEQGALRALPYEPRPRRDRGWFDQLLRESVLISRLEAAYATLLESGRDAYASLSAVARGSAPPVDATGRSERSVYADILSVFSDRPSEAWQEAWRITEELLVATRDQAAAADVPLLLVYAPSSFEVYPEEWESLRVRFALPAVGWDLEGPNRRVAEIAARRGIAYLDLRPALREAAGAGPRLYFTNDRHWSPAGHEVVARVLAGALADGKLLAASPPPSSPSGR